MRIIDLTMPLYEGMGYSTIYPLETPFKIETIGTRWTRQIFHINGEPGTRRIMLSGAGGADGKKATASNIVLQDTAIVDVGHKGPDEKVTPEDVERGFANADFREGDAVIFRTGWGDNESYRKLGQDYEWLSPTFGRDDTFKKMAEYMGPKKSKLFCYDTANCLDMKTRYKKWLDIKPRPKPWPSPEAKEFLDKWTKDETMVNLGKPGEMLGRLSALGITAIGALVNCGDIKKKRVKLIALPLKVDGATLAPCNVIAIEE